MSPARQAAKKVTAKKTAAKKVTPSRDRDVAKKVVAVIHKRIEGGRVNKARANKFLGELGLPQVPAKRRVEFTAVFEVPTTDTRPSGEWATAINRALNAAGMPVAITAQNISVRNE